MAEIVPTEEMTRFRRILDMEYALDGNPASKYGALIARWLPGQLPGRDMGNVGWGLLLVATFMTPRPERRGPNSAVKAGMRSVMMNAGLVGKALIDSGSPGPAAELSPDVSWNLADLRTAIADLVREAVADLPPGMDVDMAELNREIPGALHEAFPGVDVSGTGWAALGTGMVLAREVQEVYRKAAHGLMRRSSRERRVQWANGAMLAAIFMARMGDFFISQS
jgi:hypothetical protein